MAYNVITKRMGMGFPGQVARQSFNVIETHAHGDSAVLKYGRGVFMGEDGKVYSQNTTPGFWGVIARPDAVQLGGDNPAFGDAGVLDPKQPVDVLVKGYINVKYTGSYPDLVKLGASVFVWTTAGDGHEVGDFTDTAPTGAIQVANAKFMGPVDENGIVQIRLL